MAMSQRSAHFKAREGQSGQKPPPVHFPQLQVQRSRDRLGMVCPAGRTAADHAVRFPVNRRGGDFVRMATSQLVDSRRPGVLLAVAVLHVYLCRHTVESRSIIRRAQARRRSLRDASRKQSARRKHGRFSQPGFEAGVHSRLGVHDFTESWLSYRSQKRRGLGLRRQEPGQGRENGEVRCHGRREKGVAAK